MAKKTGIKKSVGKRAGKRAGKKPVKRKRVKKPVKKPFKSVKKKSKKSKKGSKKHKKVPKVGSVNQDLHIPPPPIQGEFICIHIGQAGIQVGSICWELFCLEHGINPDGTVHKLTTNSTSMFSLSQANTYVPRAMLVDTEPSVIDVIKTGNYKKLFTSQSIISGKESASSNYAAGYYGVGKTLSQAVMDQLTRLAENCNSLQGIAVFRSTGGGTGSGMGSRIIETIKNSYPNKSIIDFNISSTLKQSPVIVEPYNNAFSTNHVLNMVNCSMLFDNSSLYSICSSKLEIPKPTYRNINSIIALVASGITSSVRFEGSIMRNISELLTNLIPHPRLHFPLITHAPLTNKANNISSASTELATMSFDRNYQMIKVDPKLGKYLSVCMMFRGDLLPTDINTAIAFVQREQSIPITQNMNSPLFKFGLCYQPPVTVPYSGIVASTKTVTSLCNNTSVKKYWIQMIENYNKMFDKRAFVHHYTGEGMEESMFSTTKENILNLIAEYEGIERS